MSVEENKAAIRRIYEEVFNKGNLAVADEIIATNWVARAPGGQEYRDPDGFKQFITMTRNAFPDLQMTLEDIVAEGDKVAHCATLQGTFKGEIMGIAPTGKQVTMTTTTISRFEGGKEVEARMIYDQLSMYQQMGVSPPTG
jgi:predicted ester cyclase